MQATLVLFSLCLIMALAVPSWGGSKKSSPNKTPQQVSVTPAPVVLPGGYVRDATQARKMQQHLKEMRLKAKEAAASREAAKAEQADPATTAPPQQNKGGTQ